MPGAVATMASSCWSIGAWLEPALALGDRHHTGRMCGRTRGAIHVCARAVSRIAITFGAYL